MKNRPSAVNDAPRTNDPIVGSSRVMRLMATSAPTATFIAPTTHTAAAIGA